MAIEGYWASTARNAKDIAQYAAYPLFKMAGMAIFHDTYKANVLAGAATTAFYTGLTYSFFGLESDNFTDNVREAAGAEFGVDPKKLKFSDLYDSKNTIIKKRMDLFSSENSYRYPLGFIPMLPTVMENVTRSVKGMQPSPGEELRVLRPRIKSNPKPVDHFLGGWGLWDHAVYAGVAMAWLAETYFIDKTAAYELEKVAENEDSVARMSSPNSWIAVYNRMREDSKLPMIDSKADREKLWPLLEVLNDKYNTSPNITRSAVCYLMGMGHMDIFAKNEKGEEIKDAKGNRAVDAQAYQHALDEIDRVERIGLSGIAEENANSHHVTRQKPPEKQGFVERLNRGFMDMQFNTYQKLFGHRKSVEFISPRDPGETPLSMP